MADGSHFIAPHVSVIGVDNPRSETPPHFQVFTDIPWLDARIFKGVGGVSTGLYAARNGRPGLNCVIGGGDAPEAKAENRRIVADVFGVTADRLLTTREEDSNVRIVRDPWTLDIRPYDNALVVSQLYDHPIGMLTANCCPVLFADKTKPITGIAHIGTLQALDGLMEMTIREMEYLGSDRKNIALVLGPCIGVEGPTYIINAKDDTYCEQFKDRDPEIGAFFVRTGEMISGRMATALMLQSYLGHRLEKDGITDIRRIREDTALRPEYFSRGEQPSGLMFSGVMLRGNVLGS